MKDKFSRQEGGYIRSFVTGIMASALTVKPDRSNRNRRDTPSIAIAMGGEFHDAESWSGRFRDDLRKAEQEVMIASPGLSAARVEAFLHDALPALQRGVRVYVTTLAPEVYPEQVRAKIRESMEKLRQAGIAVRAGTALHTHAAVFDGKLAWYGNLNLLSSAKPENDMMRVESEEIAAELLAGEKAQEKKEVSGEERHVQTVSEESKD